MVVVMICTWREGFFVSKDLYSLEPGLVGIILRNGLLPGSMHSSSNSSANAFFVPSSLFMSRHAPDIRKLF